jgi:hypothetical protein
MTKPSRMTPRERMLATFAGQPVDHFPVTAPYLMLLQSDHWVKITGQPPQTYYAWNLQEPEEHVREFERFHRLLPFDITQPNFYVAPREVRRRCRIISGEDGQNWYEVDPVAGERKQLVLNLHEKDQDSEWERVVFSWQDADETIHIQTAQEILDAGELDYVIAYKKVFGNEHYIAGNLVNAFYNSSWSVGLKNRFLMLYDEPDLLHYVIGRYHRKNIEQARAMKQAGTDMVFIDDATATKDMISVKMYCEFSLPYMKLLVDEIHNLGMKAVLIYFGGIADRVEEILSVGADGLMMETSMKGFVNDLDRIAAQVNDRTLMFGNLNPREDVELMSDAELEAAMSRQITVGKKFGRFVVSTGSPLTPSTSLARMQKYIELSRSLSEYSYKKFDPV